MSAAGAAAAEEGLLEPFSLDQAGATVVLVLGAVGALLGVIMKTRCRCRFRLGFGESCYLCACDREPPPLELAAGAEGSGEEDEEAPAPGAPRDRKSVV